MHNGGFILVIKNSVGINRIHASYLLEELAQIPAIYLNHKIKETTISFINT